MQMNYRYALVRERGEPLVEGGLRSGRTLDLEECMRRSRAARRGITVGVCVCVSVFLCAVCQCICVFVCQCVCVFVCL